MSDLTEDAVSMAGEGQTTATVNAVENKTWLKPRVETSLADPGGYELGQLDGGRWAQRCGELHASAALARRRSGDTSNCNAGVANCVRKAERMLHRLDRGCERYPGVQ